MSLCTLVHLLQHTVWAVVMSEQLQHRDSGHGDHGAEAGDTGDHSSDGDLSVQSSEDGHQKRSTEEASILAKELTRCRGVTSEEVVSFGVSRYSVYRRMKYNVMAVQI